MSSVGKTEYVCQVFYNDKWVDLIGGRFDVQQLAENAIEQAIKRSKKYPLRIVEVTVVFTSPGWGE